jgi:hypothetical protein
MIIVIQAKISEEDLVLKAAASREKKLIAARYCKSFNKLVPSFKHNFLTHQTGKNAFINNNILLYFF